MVIRQADTGGIPTMNTKVYAFEQALLLDLDAKRDKLKARPPAFIHYNLVGEVLTCRECWRTFNAKIWYVSHLRVRTPFPSVSKKLWPITVIMMTMNYLLIGTIFILASMF